MIVSIRKSVPGIKPSTWAHYQATWTIPTEKKYMYLYDYIRMVEMWSTKQYNILCKNLHEFPALGKKEKKVCTVQEILVIYNSCPLLCLCIAKKLLQKILINFSISMQWYSDCPKNSGISCADLTIFAISLLLWVIFLSIQGNFLPCWGLYLNPMNIRGIWQ